jgi:hypothetical protein
MNATATTPTAQALRREIRTAFAGRTYPGDDRLAIPGPDCRGDDRDDVKRFFRGKDWREVRLDSLLDGSDLDPNAFLSFLSPEGFVYFLPAFLIESLHLADDRFDLGEPLAFRLTPSTGNPEDPGLQAARDLLDGILSALTPEEKRAVAHVLEYLAREYDQRSYTLNLAQAALDSYWAPQAGS